MTGGHLLISVPFGFREAMVHPVTHKISFQVFDKESIDMGLQALDHEGIEAQVEVLSISDEGWFIDDPATCRARYADGCPAAASVAMVRAWRK